MSPWYDTSLKTITTNNCYHFPSLLIHQMEKLAINMKDMQNHFHKFKFP